MRKVWLAIKVIAGFIALICAGLVMIPAAPFLFLAVWLLPYGLFDDSTERANTYRSINHENQS